MSELKWEPMSTAPKGKCQHVRVIMKDGTIHDDVHYAYDLSGEEQPPFKGWFIPRGNGYEQIDEPVGWRTL